ncbi:MAG: EAL domain-containing protein [Betaproteobacteria bacterium]|nr:MAG: EAL domain-containing protein [Betaproteobacteria bacterium]
MSKTGDFNQREPGAKVQAALLISIAAAAGILLAVLAWSFVEIRDGRWSFAITSVALPWLILLAAVTIGALVFGVSRLRAPAVRRTATDLGDRLIEVLRSGEYDLAKTQRVATEVIEALPNPIYFKADNGRHIGADEAWQRLFGVSRTAFVCNLVQELYPRKPDAPAAPQAAAKHQRQQVFKTTISTGGGDRVDTIRRKAAIEPADLSAAGLIGTIINIVERKEAELFDMLGYAKEELVGKTFRDTPGTGPYGSNALRGGQQAQGAMISLATEKPATRKNGKIGWDQWTVAVVSDKTGTPEYLFSVVEDITERKLNEQRQAMERSVNRVLAETATVAAAIPKLIQGICQSMEWRFGTCWIYDRESAALRFRDAWWLDAPELYEFMADHAQRVIKPEPTTVQGLVQRTFMAGKPVWVANFAEEPGFAGAALLARAGLHGAFGFPLLVGNKVLGVMEFFHSDVPEPNDALLTTVHSIGSQIGQYMARLEAEDTVKVTAAYDPLTELPNREIFKQRLEHAFVQAERRGSRLAVMFIDLDHFKVVNDTLGHEAGDTLLCEVAKRLQANLRASDTVARLGGDEFVVLIEDLSDPLYVSNLARKLIEVLSEAYVVAGNECHVTASIGSSTYPEDGEDVTALLKNADIAMYRAKERGRNSFQFFSEQMNTDAVERLTVEADLRRALDRNELVLHYQPKIDVRTGRVTGLEALVRWQHPELGLVPPAHFMQVANETGLIVPISEWVLQTACATSKDLPQHGLPRMPIAVNLSRRQFLHGNLVKEIERVLGETSCSADAIALEITEGMVTHDPERAIMLIRNLKALGLQIVIDDFGTGYSSLNYLQRFPVDALKIDRSFVKTSTEAGGTSIAQAIIAMAHNLKFKVIAEGVENKQQFDFLREHGCNEIQGYYVSKPLALVDAIAFVQGKSGTCSLA